jgi:beta-phosphoglucomutase
MIKAVIFDFDGVIADTEQLHFASYLEVLEPKGLGFTYQEYADRYMAYDSLGCLRKRAEDLDHPLDPATLRTWVTDKNAAYQRLLDSASVPPLPGAVEAVTLAAARGPVAVCTGAVLQDVEPLLRAFGLTALLNTVVTADDVQISKPDPESYVLACTRLGTPPSLCLAVEDTPGGLRSARDAGCQTLGITTTHRGEELSPHADRVFTSLLSFPDLFA